LFSLPYFTFPKDLKVQKQRKKERKKIKKRYIKILNRKTEKN